MRHWMIAAVFATLALVGAGKLTAEGTPVESQVKTSPGDYVLFAANRVVLRIHVKTGRTFVHELREWTAVAEPSSLPEGEYDLLMTYARTVTEIFRIEKKTGKTWGLGYSDSDPKRQKPLWFVVTETPFPPPLDERKGT